MQDIESLKEDNKSDLFAIVDAYLRDAKTRQAYASKIKKPTTLLRIPGFSSFFVSVLHGEGCLLLLPAFHPGANWG